MFASLELQIVVTLAIILFLLLPYLSKISLTFLLIFSCLFALFLIGMKGIFSQNLYNFIKDITYFARPLLWLIVGFGITQKTKNIQTIFNSIIIAGVLMAIFHLFRIIFTLNFASISVEKIRESGGLDNFAEVFSIIILLFEKRYNTLTINKKHQKIFLTILLLSFVLYFSRANILVFFFGLLAYSGIVQFNAKNIFRVSVVLLGIVAFVIVLQNFHFKKKAKGVEWILYKIQKAPEEVFATKVNVHNHKERWEKWRAYEALCAYNQTKENGALSMILGNGFGAQIDLKIKVELGNQVFRKIPITHNGYIYVFFKTGILGLLFYILMLFFIAFPQRKGNLAKASRAMLLVISAAIFLTSFIVSGIFNHNDATLLIAGMMLLYPKTISQQPNN